MGQIGCGSFPEEAVFSERTSAIAALFRLYRRIEHKKYAAESYAAIDSLLPANTPLKEALALNRSESRSLQSQLQSFTDTLNLVATEDEWRRLNDYARAAFSGTPPFLNDQALLVSRLSDQHPEVHRTAALKLMDLPSPDRWSVVAQCLDDYDNEVSKTAAYIITGNHRLDLFGRVLRKPSEIFNKDYFVTSLEDGDITGLLAMEDAVVDDYCFDAITRCHRFHFLGLLLDKLNRHDNEKTLRAIRTLLDGPKALDGEGDPWDRIKPLSAPLSELKDIIRVGTA